MKPFAFVFPGQGSQAVGMLNPWGDHPAILKVLEEASGALGEDLGRLIHEGPRETLSLTVNTQPVMLVAGIAAFRAWRSEGGQLPSVVAGHSLGEYSALVAAEVLTLQQAVSLVRFRAQAMQNAVPVGVGAMAVIMGLDAAAVVAGCRAALTSLPESSGQVVEAVNFNDPMQTVIAGTKGAVETACEHLKAAGAKRAMLLPVSAPFHSSLMKPAAQRLKERLEAIEFRAPRIPVVNNIDVTVEMSSERIRDALFRQAAGPVRWVECVRAIRARGVDLVVECGPGKVLAGLCKRIDPLIQAVTLSDPAGLRDLKELTA